MHFIWAPARLLVVTNIAATDQQADVMHLEAWACAETCSFLEEMFYRD